MGKQWVQLLRNPIITFEPEDRYSRDIVVLGEHVYDSSKGMCLLAGFLPRAWVLRRRNIKDTLEAVHGMEAVIGCVSGDHLRVELLNAEAAMVPELISFAISMRGRLPHSSSDSTLQSGRPRLSEGVSCRICKRSVTATAIIEYSNLRKTNLWPEGMNRERQVGAPT